MGFLHFRKPLNGSKVLVLGIAYKQEVADYRESPALRVIDCLKAECADVLFYDPYVNEYRRNGNLYYGVSQLTKQILRDMDIVIITTAHTNVDYDFVRQHSKFVFDTKNVMKNIHHYFNVEVL